MHASGDPTSGFEDLDPREPLALVLQAGHDGIEPLNLANVILADQGNLAALARAHVDDLARLPGMDAARAAAVVAAFQLARLAARESAPTVLRRPADVADIATAELGGAQRERVIVLVCDAGNRLRRVVRVSEGSVDRALFPLREILNTVLRYDGRAFAVAHGHPAGDPEPSDADVGATRELSAAARIVGLRFLGHVVVAGSAWQIVGGERRGWA
ncbi:MAG: DNA repair protein [Chloroflexi bacterium]|nr:DNA repair protein [Chloroflexota bacterium]